MNQSPQPTTMPNSPQPAEVHLQDYLQVIKRRQKTFLIAFFTVLTVVILVTFLMKPVYESNATLYVKDEKGKMGLLGELALNSANPVDSELEILKSRTNAENVVKRLHLDWGINKKSTGLTFKLLEFTATAGESSYKVELTGGDSFSVQDGDGNRLGTGRSGQLLRGKGITLLLSDLRGKAGDSFRLDLLPFNETVENLRKQIKASEVGKKTNIISLTYRDNNPELARDVLNTLIQVYLEQTVSFKTEEASRTVGFVEEQLQGVRGELDKAEQNLQSYKTASGVVQLDAEAQNLLQTITEAEKQKADIALQKKQFEFALSSLKEARRRGVTYSPAIMRDDPLVSGIAAKLADLEMQKRALLAENTESHPSVKIVQGQIDEVQKKIQATYETGLKNLAKQELNVGQLIARYEKELRILPARERDLARLTRLSKVNADIYTFLLQKHEESRIAKASTISNINVVDPALTPDKPVSPKKKKNLLLGFLVGAMLGVGIVFFQEYLDDTIKDADEAKRVLGLPLLAVIPFIASQVEADGSKTEEAMASFVDPKSPVAEAFRSLRTSIHFSAINRQKKALLITSTFPGEGKSTIAANLAITLAQTGVKVLIVDCDMRRPSLHEKFSHSRTPGLTELLAGDAEINDIVHNSGIPGLDFISSGTIPPNPAELLGSEAMSQFIAEQRGFYDHIVIDAPPVLAVTDASVLTVLSDLVLVVVETGRVPLKAAGRLRELLATTHAPVAGLVISDRKDRGSAYGYYGDYRYGYGYYGEGPQKEKERWWQRLKK